MFALWCLVKAPLMLGSDLRTITRESAAYRTITNSGLLAVNQDKLGVQVGPVVEVVGVEGGGSRLAQGECVKDCCSHNDIHHHDHHLLRHHHHHHHYHRDHHHHHHRASV